MYNSKISVQETITRTQNESVRSYCFTNKPINQHQQSTKETKDSLFSTPKISIRDDKINYEKINYRQRSQLSTTTMQPIGKSTTNESNWSGAVALVCPTLIEPSRSTTAPLILEEDTQHTISARIISTTRSRSPTRFYTSRRVDSTDNSNSLISSSLSYFKPKITKSESLPARQRSIEIKSNHNHFLDVPLNTNLFDEKPIFDQNESKIIRRNSQSKTNGYQHIVNLGRWQRNSKNHHSKPSEISQTIDCDDEVSNDIEQSPPTPIYEYKSPFSDEYDQAIYYQGQINLNNNSTNEWNLKDFYRDVKTNFEPETNTKSVFEKCIKLAKLQANTIKWEQRRRQNLNIYNRLLKTGTLDSSALYLNGNLSTRNNNDKDIRDINELKRELRCNECKRLGCLGNCAPGQEYRQYKRCNQFSTVTNTRDPFRCKLSLRLQRSAIDLRPRSTQPVVTRDTKYKFEPSTVNSVVVVPTFEDEYQIKRSQKKIK